MSASIFTSDNRNAAMVGSRHGSRRRIEKGWRWLVVFSVACVMAGCAAHRQEPRFQAENDPLYDGVNAIAFDSVLTGDPDADFEQIGDQALRKGEQDKAIYAYLRATQRGGDKAVLFSKIGAVQHARGNHKLSLMAYSRALEADPESVQALQGAGLVSLGLRHYYESENYLEKALQLDQARFVSVQVQVPPADNGELSEVDSIPSLDHDASSPYQVYNGLGVLADLAGDYPKALRYYQVANAIRPHSALIQNNLGYSYYLNGDLASAERHFLRAINLNSGFMRSWHNLALVYVRQGRNSEALSVLTKVMSSAKAYNTLGYLNMLEGKRSQAERYLQEAISLSPSYYALAQQNLERNRRPINPAIQ